MEAIKKGDKVVVVESSESDEESVKFVGKEGIVVADYGDVFKVKFNNRVCRFFTTELKVL